MTVLSVEGHKYYSEDGVVKKRGDLFAEGKPRSIFLNKNVEINKEKDCLFFYLKKDKWVVTTSRYCKAIVFFSGEWLKKMKIKVGEEDNDAEDIKPVMERTGVTAGAKVEENIEAVIEKLKTECKDTITDSDKGLFKACKLGDSHYITDYLDFKNVIIDKNGYFNATKLCRKGGKEYRDWIRTSQAKNMIEKMDEILDNKSKSEKMHSCFYVEESKQYNTVIRGTYLHPDLVVHLATWISFEFANKVSQIVKRFVTIEIEAKIKQMKLDNMNIKEELSKSELARQRAEEEYAKAEEREQKAEAARQEEKLARQKAEEREEKAEAARQKAEEEYTKAEIARKESEKQRTAAMAILNRLEIKLTDVETTLDEQVDVTTQIKNVLEDTVDRNVPKNSNHAKKYENLYLVRKNQRCLYKLHRVQHLVEIPLEKGEEIICTIKDTPNSVNLGNAIKQRLLDLIPNIRIKNSIIDASDVECSSIENLENTLKNTCLSEHEKRVTTPLNKIPIAIDKRKKTRY